MKKELDIYKLIEDMEQNMCELYATNEILEMLKQDEDYVEVSLAAVMSDCLLYTSPSPRDRG